MSHDFGDELIVKPAFKPEDALVGLRRQLRELKGLADRGSRFEVNGKPVLDAKLEAGSLMLRLAKRPAVSPEWETHALGDSAAVRKFVDEVKRRLARWQNDDER